MATLDQAVEQMQADGMPPFPDGGPRLNTPAVVRYGPKKRAWYRLFEVQGKNGRGYVYGAYGLFGQFETRKVRTDWGGLDAADRERMEAEQRSIQKAEEEKRKARATAAANRARTQWIAGKTAGDSPYLERKGVEADGRSVRFLDDGTLLVPMLRYDLEKPKIFGLQKIAPDGQKRFTSGMAKEGTACLLGPRPKDGELIMIAEGYATGASVRMALKKAHPVFVAFDAGTLMPAARIVRERWPKSPVLVLADDDFRTVCFRHEREGVSRAVDPEGERPAWCQCNPGTSKALQVANAIGNARMVRPVFAQRDPELKQTDFNDLHAAEGLDVVAKQVGDAIQALSGPEAALKAGSKRKKRPPEFWDRLDAARKGWVLIRGTDTLYEGATEEIMKVAHMRLAEGKDLVNIWLSDPSRRTVQHNQVVFDPTGQADPDTHVNLFSGLKCVPTKPGEATCEKLLQLLHYLCGEDDAVFDWVLKWCAYPLQHPGAKMQSAVVMYGPEGTGKNLWWKSIRRIYEPYSSLISQAELESAFNAWTSRKLFVVGNEVVSRQERQHHVGYLKNLVTEDVIQVNEKHLPLREEANHMQIVFLSNEFQPLQISPDDRRYQIIRTPPKLEKAFYRGAAEELGRDGHRALLAYLLDMDLGEFNEHTEPVMTQAKQNLIQVGKASPRLFFDEIVSGEAKLPFGPCLVKDAYQAFRIWCARNGDRMPAQLKVFRAQWIEIEGVEVARKYFGPPEDEKSKQASVFVMGPGRAEAGSERAWLTRGIVDFQAKLELEYKPDG